MQDETNQGVVVSRLNFNGKKCIASHGGLDIELNNDFV